MPVSNTWFSRTIEEGGVPTSPAKVNLVSKAAWSCCTLSGLSFLAASVLEILARNWKWFSRLRMTFGSRSRTEAAVRLRLLDFFFRLKKKDPTPFQKDARGPAHSRSDPASSASSVSLRNAW